MLDILLPSNPNIYFYGTIGDLMSLWVKFEKTDFWGSTITKYIEVEEQAKDLKPNNVSISIEKVIQRIRCLISISDFYFLNSEVNSIKVKDSSKIYTNTFYKKNPYNSEEFILLEKYIDELNSYHLNELFKKIPLLGVKSINLESFYEYNTNQSILIKPYNVVDIGLKNLTINQKHYFVRCEYGLPINRINYENISSLSHNLNFILNHRISTNLCSIEVEFTNMTTKDYSIHAKALILQKKHGLSVNTIKSFKSLFKFTIVFYDKNILIKNKLLKPKS